MSGILEAYACCAAMTISDATLSCNALVLLHAVPKNTESRFIAWCLRWFRRYTDLLTCMSFADPARGHVGTIYQTGGWIYTGVQDHVPPRLIIDGSEVHPRTAVAKYGTWSIPKLQARGLRLDLRPRVAKHRYVYVLRPELRPLLKYEAQPYPKARQC